jgi:hypothetical protein
MSVTWTLGLRDAFSKLILVEIEDTVVETYQVCFLVQGLFEVLVVE